MRRSSARSGGVVGQLVLRIRFRINIRGGAGERTGLLFVGVLLLEDVADFVQFLLRLALHCESALDRRADCVVARRERVVHVGLRVALDHPLLYAVDLVLKRRFFLLRVVAAVHLHRLQLQLLAHSAVLVPETVVDLTRNHLHHQRLVLLRKLNESLVVQHLH